MQLTTNFKLEEFQLNDAIPKECVLAFTSLAKYILEPVRAKFNVPLQITSGYRSPRANAEAHGQPNSEHVATPTICACDFYPVPPAPGLVTTQDVFDYMRNSPTLPYHQLILEHGVNASVIHVSFNASKYGVRSVLIGATHNSEPYTKADHVPYEVASNRSDVQAASAG